MTLSKQDFVAEVMEKTELSKKDTEATLNAILETIGDILARKDKVTFVGFGTFETRERAEREGRNPHTGEKISIAATTAPAFKPGKALKEKVNG